MVSVAHDQDADPLGILNENEIYYRSSTPMRDPNTQTLFHVITGEMLVRTRFS